MSAAPTYQAGRSRQGELGFTLVELVASLAIMAVVMTLLASSVHTLASSWERQIRGLEDNDGLMRGLSVFRQDLRATRMVMNGSKDARHVAFKGDARSLSFVSDSPRQSPGPKIISYAVRRNGNRLQLVRRSARYHHETSLTRPVGGRHDIVIDGLKAADLSYRAETGPWASQWSDRLSLPRLIRFRLASDQGPPVPAIIVQVRSDVAPACVASTAKNCAPEASRLAGTRSNAQERTR